MIDHENFGGAVEFSVFEDASNTQQSHATVLGDLLEVDPIALLKAVTPQIISLAEFHGDWFDPKAQRLIQKGNWNYGEPKRWFQTSNVTTYTDPYLTDLPKVGFQGGGHSPPDMLDRGQFAYAVTQPPYSMRKMPAQERLTKEELEQHYLALVTDIMPDPQSAIIYDWVCQEIVDFDGECSGSHSNVSLQAGMEWWGIYVMTVFCPFRRYLTAIVASATD